MAIYPVPNVAHNNRVARLRVSDCVLKQLVARSIPAWMLFFSKGQTVSCGHQRMAIYPVPRASHNNRVARLRVSNCVLKQLVARSIPAWMLFFQRSDGIERTRPNGHIPGAEGRLQQKGCTP
jgi:ribosomal protein L28